MLYLRLLTAMCLIPLVIWGVIKLPPAYFEGLFALIALLGAIEWAKLCHFSHFMSKSLFVIAVAVGMWLACTFNAVWLLAINVLFWGYALAAVFTYSGHRPLPFLKNNGSKAVIGVLCLVSAWYALVIIRQLEAGAVWIIILFALIWSSDSFAYFIGKKWGKTPLAPSVSPKKTWQGFWSGLLGPLLLSGVGLSILQLPYLAQYKPAFFNWSYFPVWMSVFFVILLLGILGDLFESLIKRISGVKDSGTLLPGHGGILDRIDSLLSTLPFFALCLLWLLGH